MNRGLLIVKVPGKDEYLTSRVHWSYGDSLQEWLTENAPTYEAAKSLVLPGGMSTVHGTEDWQGKALPSPRPLYYYERGDTDEACEIKATRNAALNAEHITAHVFTRGKWRMIEHDYLDR